MRPRLPLGFSPGELKGGSLTRWMLLALRPVDKMGRRRLLSCRGVRAPGVATSGREPAPTVARADRRSIGDRPSSGGDCSALLGGQPPQLGGGGEVGPNATVKPFSLESGNDGAAIASLPALLSMNIWNSDSCFLAFSSAVFGVLPAFVL
jgi:hypothetical protein